MMKISYYLEDIFLEYLNGQLYINIFFNCIKKILTINPFNIKFSKNMLKNKSYLKGVNEKLQKLKTGIFQFHFFILKNIVFSQTFDSIESNQSKIRDELVRLLDSFILEYTEYMFIFPGNFLYVFWHKCIYGCTLSIDKARPRSCLDVKPIQV